MFRPFCLSLLLSAILTTAGFLSDQPTSSTNPGNNRLPVFTDVTREAGVAYKITCGDEVTEYQIDVNGEGAAFFDYDNDGYQDIYLVNGSSRKSVQSGKPPHDYLLHNNGDGTFTEVTERARLGDIEWSSGVAVGDYDNDGYLDLYVTNFGPNKLYHNNGDGTFSEVGEKAGVVRSQVGISQMEHGRCFW